MSADWPGSLPTAFKLRTPSGSPGDGAKRTPVDRGPPMVRVSTFVAPDTLTGVMDMSAAQFATLLAFYKTTLSQGTLQFTMFDPKGGPDREVMFREPPAEREAAFDHYEVSLSLWVLP